MSYGFTEIDHLLASADPARGGPLYERLGFTVTPASVHVNLGVANRLIILQPVRPGTLNFFECMGVVDRERVNPAMKAVLAGPDGIRSMVLSGPDARATHARLAADGYAFRPIIDVDRQWQLPSGESIRPSVLVTVPLDTALPFNFCQYRNLECYLRDEWLRHENGALHMTSVFAVAPDPDESADYFARLFGRPPAQRGGIYSIAPGIVELQIGDVAAMASLLPRSWLGADLTRPRYVGFEVQIRSLSALRSLLSGRGVEFVEQGSALVVAPHEACGNIIRFTEAR